MSLVVGIDPGTHCGWAVLKDGRHAGSGTWDLSPKRFEGAGMRIVRLRRLLGELLTTLNVDVLGYEEVRRHLGADAARVYGGIVGAIQAECEERSIPYFGVMPSAAKRAATGKGRCEKAEMVTAANARWKLQIEDDNEADALWIAACALEEVGK